MPFYKTTKNIFVDFDEHFDPNWMDRDEIYIPPNDKWDYQREMKLEDVDLWETIWEGEISVFAAYQPYAEFFLVTFMVDFLEAHPDQPPFVTFYGKHAQTKLSQYLNQWNIKLPINNLWVEDNEMWLYK